MITGIIASSVNVLAAFTDEFTPAGAFHPRWIQTRGTWVQNSGNAGCTSPVSAYPLLTFNANTERVSVRTSQVGTSQFGWGVSFWVVDANNWWAAIIDRTAYSCIVGYTSGCCACGDSGSGNDCGCAGCYCCNCVTGAQVSFAGSCPQPSYGTCYSYNLRVLQSVGGTISNISTTAIASGDIGNSLTVGYVQVVTNAAGQYTATAQMSTGGTIATATGTPSTARSRRHGLILGPATEGTQATTLERMIYSPV